MWKNVKRLYVEHVWAKNLILFPCVLLRFPRFYLLRSPLFFVVFFSAHFSVERFACRQVEGRKGGLFFFDF